MKKLLHLVIGASENPVRYSNMAIHALQRHQLGVIAVGSKPGKINELSWDTEMKAGWIDNVDTVTLYINPDIQPLYYESILALHPRRVIFNPGTENSEFMEMLPANNIVPIAACTLVMLSIGTY